MIKVLQVNVDDMGCGGVYSLVRSFIQNKPADIAVDIACIEQFERSENVAYLNALGTGVYYIGSNKNKISKQFAVYSNLKSLIERNGYDVVHIHSDVANKLYVCGRAAKAAGAKKIILHSHAAGVDGGHRLFKTIFHKCSQRKLRKVGTCFLSCSTPASEWMFPSSADKVQIINNGVNLSAFRFDPEARRRAREDLGISSGLIIGHIGRFAYQKNHEYLIEVFSAIAAQRADSKLLLIGEGERMEEIKALVKAKNLADKVIFYGLCADVARMMQAMDVFLLPSRFEGLPIVGVEAQAAGLPCIFSDAVTREAALTPAVSFIKTQSENIPDWSAECLRMAGLPRSDNYAALRAARFDITDTVASLSEVYRK